jgi:hypothetical protein
MRWLTLAAPLPLCAPTNATTQPLDIPETNGGHT